MRASTMGILLAVSMAYSVVGCRLRKDHGSDYKSSTSYRLFATCTSDAKDAKFTNIVVQDDASIMRGLMLLESSAKSVESQKVVTAAMTVESREGTEIRKSYQAEGLVFTIELQRQGTDTFVAKLSDSNSNTESAYSCAL